MNKYHILSFAVIACLVNISSHAYIGPAEQEAAAQRLQIVQAVFQDIDTMTIFRLQHAIERYPVIAHVRNQNSDTLLHIATKPEHIALLLIKGADVNAENSDRRTPLHEQQDVLSAAALLHFGADVNARDAKGDTPLHLAASVSVELVDLLIEKNADTTLKNAKGDTPVHSLCYMAGWIESTEEESLLPMLDSLLVAGVSIDAVNNHGRTALRIVAEQKNERLARVLLRHTTHIDQQTKAILDQNISNWRQIRA